MDQLNQNKVRVILAEDESISAIDISYGLKKLGYNVIKIVSRGKDLIEESLKSQPDVIVSDIYLKDEITGVEAVKILTEKKFTPIILISGNNDNYTITRVREVNPCGFLAKPISPMEIHNQIQKCLQVK